MTNIESWRAVWVKRIISPVHEEIRQRMVEVSDKVHHWSRGFEYPWTWLHGDFQPGQLVLDAAGGDSPFQTFVSRIGAQVINVDIDPDRQTVTGRGILRARGDLRNLEEFIDGLFDRVVCLSVLEHVDKPLDVMKELWRIVRPGGRLIVSFDVASFLRWNHTIDEPMATGILGVFGQQTPNIPHDVLTIRLPEWEPQPGKPGTVDLRCLCFVVEKLS